MLMKPPLAKIHSATEFFSSCRMRIHLSRVLCASEYRASVCTVLIVEDLGATRFYIKITLTGIRMGGLLN